MATYREIRKPRLYEDLVDKSPNGEGKLPFLKILQYTFFIVSFVFLVSITYYSYKYVVKPVVLSELPSIVRDISPIRMIPEDPGGIEFANQDKEIYNSIKSSTSQDSNVNNATKASDSTQVLEILNQIHSEEKVVKSEELEKTNLSNVFQVIDTQETAKSAMAQNLKVITFFSKTPQGATSQINQLLASNDPFLKKIQHEVKPLKNYKNGVKFGIVISGFKNEQEQNNFCKKYKLKCEYINVQTTN